MAFEFPFSFVAKTEAKAAEVMGNFNALKTLLTNGIPTENIKDGAVTQAKIAGGAVNHDRLAAGYGYKENNGFIPVSIPSGSQLGAVGTFAHGLGVQPVGFDVMFSTAANYAIAFEPRLIAWDANNITWQMICSTPVPGLFEGGAYWRAWANA